MDRTLVAKQKVNQKRNKIRHFDFVDGIMLFVMCFFALTILFPFYNAILISIVPQALYVRSPFMLWPQEVIFDAYKFVFKNNMIWSSVRNSIFITIVGTIYNMVLTVLMGYAFSKKFPFRRFLRLFIVFTMYFSGGMIPTYFLMKDLKLMDSLWVMILPSGIAIMSMLVISNYFKSLPPALEESAKIDGANDWVVLLQIVLPLALPLLATFTLYYAVDRWNDWFPAKLYIKSTELWPLQYTLQKIISDANFAAQNLVPGQAKSEATGESVKMAAIVVTMFPLMAIYPFLQKYFITGLTLGAVKE